MLSINKLARFTGYALVGLMMLFPLQFPFIKSIILTFLLFVTLFFIDRLRSAFVGKILLWGYLYMFVGLCAISYGLLLHNPAPQKYFLVYVIWPILFTYLSLFIGYQYFKRLLVCTKICLLLILIIGVIACLKFNIEFIQEGEFLGYEAMLRPGFPIIAIAGAPITTVLFWYFFFYSLVLLKSNISKIDWIILLLGVIFIFMTSRRILFLNFFLAPLFEFLFLPFIKGKEERNNLVSIFKKRMQILFVLLFLVVCVAELFGWVSLDSLGDFFSKTSDVSDEPRHLQASALIEGWMDSPILGHGAGVNASVVRSDIPGTYELSYLAMLFERGLLGVSVFIALYVILMHWSIKCLKKNVVDKAYILSFIVAINLFMIANATNPYLNAYDYMWFLFLLLVVVRISNEEKYEKDLCANKSL